MRIGRNRLLTTGLSLVIAVAVTLSATSCDGTPRQYCNQQAWARGKTDRTYLFYNYQSWTRQSYKWKTSGFGSCTGDSTYNIGLDYSNDRTGCWEAWGVLDSHCMGNTQWLTSSETPGVSITSDYWSKVDWNGPMGSGRAHVHTKVQGFRSGNASTTCSRVAMSGGEMWDAGAIVCTGGNS